MPDHSDYGPPDSQETLEGMLSRIKEHRHEFLTSLVETLRVPATPDAYSVRDLLAMFAHERRRAGVCEEIRAELRRYGLVTIPDFESVRLSTMLHFALSGPSDDDPIVGQEPGRDLSPREGGANKVAAYPSTGGVAGRIGLLVTQERLVAVQPEDDITVAETRMLLNDYSQVPVLRGRNDVRGVVTWRSIAEARRQGRSSGPVTCFMSSEFRVVEATCPLLKALEDLLRFEYLLVQDQLRVVSGIVTTTDLARAFGEQFEPFALLGEIEYHLRRVIHARFDVRELRGAADPDDKERVIASAADLTFGEYLRLLERESSWKRLGWKLDRGEVVQRLEEVRKIRNSVMHFSPDPIKPASLDRLRTCAAFLFSLR